MSCSPLSSHSAAAGAPTPAPPVAASTAACIEATLLEGRPHHAESDNLSKAPPQGPDSKFQVCNAATGQL
eukprot:scaffold17623_cov65-Phaeocystis_antarctica.AAC.2